MDAFAEALSALRLDHAEFRRVEIAAEEVRVAAGASGRDGLQTLVGYQVCTGTCVLERAGSPDLVLAPGTFVVLAHGEPHGLRCTIACCSLVAVRFGVETSSAPWLLPVLPALVRGEATACLQAVQSAALAWIPRAEAGVPGADAVLRRMAEAWLVQAIGLLAEAEPDLRRRFAAASDEIVQRCLALMHGRPAAPWTLPMLAREVHTSRTVLAERFAAVVGEPPISHLTRCRLGAAARMLRQTSWSLARIAEAVGYQSEPAFCRAFRRQFGAPPATWRRQAAAA